MRKRSISILILHGVCSTIMAQTLTMSNPVFWCKYDCRLQIPTEIRWTVKSSNLGTSQREPSWKFRSDVPTPYGRASHKSYVGTGYDRGHMAPASDFAKPTYLCRETFRMSNICPQVPALNRGAWKKTEERERTIARANDSCRVLAIPLILRADTTWISGKLIAVPDGFLKMIYNINPDTIYNVYFLWNK